MRDIGCSDLWDVIIEKYCDKEERKILSELPEDEYDNIESIFSDLICEIRNRAVSDKTSIKK